MGLLLDLGQSLSTHSSGKQEVTGGQDSGEAQAATALHSILAGPVNPDSGPHESLAECTCPPHGVLSSVHLYLS